MAEPVDLNSVIADSLSDAGIGEAAEVDAAADTGTEETTETTAGTEPGDTTETTVENPNAPALSDEDKLLLEDLQGFGLKIKSIQNNSRMPYRRHLSTMAREMKGYRERLTGEHTKALTERESKIAAHEARIKELETLEKMAETDPDRYIGLLAILHPDKYGKFVNRQAETRETKQSESPIARLGPRPGADQRYDDGTVGYSPEQHEKLLDWVAAKAKLEAAEESKRELEERLKPFEADRKTREQEQKVQKDFNETVKTVRGQIARGEKRWGKEVVEKHQEEIQQFLKDNKDASIEDGIDAVCLKHMRADRDAMRGDLLKELEEKPVVARKAPTSSTKVVEDAGADPVDAAIRRSLAQAGLTGK